MDENLKSLIELLFVAIGPLISVYAASFIFKGKMQAIAWIESDKIKIKLCNRTTRTIWILGANMVDSIRHQYQIKTFQENEIVVKQSEENEIEFDLTVVKWGRSDRHRFRLQIDTSEGLLYSQWIIVEQKGKSFCIPYHSQFHHRHYRMGWLPNQSIFIIFMSLLIVGTVILCPIEQENSNQINLAIALFEYIIFCYWYGLYGIRTWIGWLIPMLSAPLFLVITRCYGLSELAIPTFVFIIIGVITVAIASKASDYPTKLIKED